MAEDGVEFTVALKDEVTHHAHDAAHAMHEVGDTAKSAGEGVEHLAEAHKHLRLESEEAKGFLKEFAGSMIPEIALGELAAEGIKKLGEAVYELGEKLLDAGIELVKFSLETSEFKENTEAAFEAILGTSKEAGETYEQIGEIAHAMHIPVEKAQGMAAHLLELGLENTEEVKATVAAVSRLERAGLTEGAQKLQGIIDRALGSGEFKVEGRKLSGTGVSLPDLYEDLGKRLGKSVTEIKALMQQGKIDTQVGIASLTDLINNSKIAEIADKKFTLKDVATDWHNAWVSMTEEVNAGPLVAAFRDFVSIFSDGTDSAKGLKEGITSAVDSIIKWLAAGVEAAGIFVMKLETGFYEAEVSMAPLVKDIKQFSSDANILEELSEYAKRFGRYIGEAAIATAFLVTEGLKLSDWWRHEFDKMALAAIGRGASGGFIHGLIEGLKDGVGEVVKAAKDVAHAASNAVKDALGIHSPSEVMRGLGMQTTEGFELGMTEPGPEGAMREAYAPPPVQAAQGGGEGARHFDFSGLQIVIHSGAHAEEIMPLLESQLADVLERAANEAGA